MKILGQPTEQYVGGKNKLKKEDVFSSVRIEITGGKSSSYFDKTVKISPSLQISVSFIKLITRIRHGQWFTFLGKTPIHYYRTFLNY